MRPDVQPFATSNEELLSSPAYSMPWEYFFLHGSSKHLHGDYAIVTKQPKSKQPNSKCCCGCRHKMPNTLSCTQLEGQAYIAIQPTYPSIHATFAREQELKMMLIVNQLLQLTIPLLEPERCARQWFNEDSYIRMRHDYQRVAAYSEAIKRKAKGRTVLDIGTGAEALLAVLCAKAGAKKVYAIEANSVSAEKAKKVVKEEGLEHVISVIEGYSSDIESIPEECDLVVHEIIGEIGSKEGVVATIHDVYKRGMVKGVGSTTRKEAKTNGNHRPFASPVAPPTRAEQRWKNTEEEEEEKEEEEEEEEEIALDYNKLGGGQGNYETMKCSSFASIPMGFRSYIGPVSMPGPHYWESLPIKIIRPYFSTLR
eukprot:jgi/Bigna1/80209/fgenesh1_pg.68_\